jgi:putative phage-type endonuclease
MENQQSDDDTSETESGYELNDDEQCEYIYDIISYVFDDIFVDYFKHKFRRTLESCIYDVSVYPLEKINIDYMINTYKIMNNIIPYVSKHNLNSYQTSDDVKKQLVVLEEKNTHEQQSDEWYSTRQNKLTASSMWKIFKSESTRNSIIFEKCSTKSKPQFYGGPMEWGNKYEPVSIMLYEKIYNTKVGDFGCITHKNYPYIGASPDGIVIDETSPLYGRMLEIKNIVNRDITSVPKEEYWVQMQLQMEVCELECCDFLETRFKEYSEDEFYTDYNHQYKGIVLYFSKNIKSHDDCDAYKPHYEYYPLSDDYNKECVDAWITETENKLKEHYILYNKYYYYLDEYSCVIVQRNRKWFSHCINDITDTWNTILKERETGFEHRASKPRSNSTTSATDAPSSIVVTMNSDTDTKIIHNLESTPQVTTIKLD